MEACGEYLYVETTEAIVADKKVPFFEIILCEVMLCFGGGGTRFTGCGLGSMLDLFVFLFIVC